MVAASTSDGFTYARCGNVAKVRFPPIADIGATTDNRAMRPESVEGLIAGDVCKRLAELRAKTPWAEWRMAVDQSLSAHPSWYRDWDSGGLPGVIKGVEPLLRDAGIDMSAPEKWRGNINPDILESLRKVRDELLFDLTDQSPPPREYAEPLWQAYKLLEQSIEAMTLASGIEEPQGQLITGERQG